MFGWINKCWGGMGVTTEFERARLTTTFADWTLPDPQAIRIVISTFKGQNPETDAQAAINSFFIHLEQDDQRRNAAFLLKHLLIMDFTVEERLFLSKIGNYHNNQFIYLETGGNQTISSSIKDLVASYYEYIRAKAKFYSSQTMELVNKQTRQKFMQTMNSISMLNEINICFKIQNSILAVSDSFLNGNKSPQLIQMIFTSLLKTYLFCFSIVSFALKVFINRIPTLTKYDLQYLAKLANYFSKDYTRNLLLFIQRNKLIDSFKTLKYNQLIILDDKIVGIIDSKLREMEQDNAECPEPSEIPIEVAESLVIEKIENEGSHLRESEGPAIRVRRKKLELLRNVTADQEPETCFIEYKNFYNEDFIIQEQVAERDKSSGKKISDKMTSSKKSSQTEKKQKVYSKLSFSKDVAVPSLKKEFSMEECKKFNRQVWENWQNIYCT